MSVLINKQIHCGIVGVPFRCFVMFAFFAISMISVVPADEPHSKSGESAIAHTRAARWEPTIKAFEASDATSKPPENALLLVGGTIRGDGPMLISIFHTTTLSTEVSESPD